MRSTNVLLITSAQNDLLDPSGIGWPMVHATVEARQVAQKLGQLAAAARRASLPVIHSPISLDYDAMKNFEPNSGIQQAVISNKLLAAGTRGAEFHRDVTPQSGDIVLPPRQGFSSFWEGTIKPHLERLHVRTIYLAGMLAEACIESHTRDAVENGYRVVVIFDAVGSTSPELLEASRQTLALHSFAMKDASAAVKDWS